MQSYIKYYGKTFNNNKQLLTTTQVLSIRPYSVKVFVVPKRQISRPFQNALTCNNLHLKPKNEFR